MNPLSIIIPAYNEDIKYLQKLSFNIFKIAKINSVNIELIFVDDHSDIPLSKHKKKFSPKSKIYQMPVRAGYGNCLKFGIGVSSHDYIGIMDGDGSYCPNDLFKILRYSKKYCHIVGARSWSDIESARRIPKKCLTAVAEYLSGSKILDLNSGLRIFNKEIVVNNYGIFPPGFSFTSTLTMITLTQQLPTIFVPISYYQRHGKSKIRPIADTAKMIFQIFRMGLFFNPLKVFFPIFLVIIILGAVRAIRDVILDNYFGQLTVIIFFIAFQILFLGIFSDLVNKRGMKITGVFGKNLK